MEAIFGIACLAAVINFLYKHSSAIEDTGGRNGMDFTDVSERIDRVNEIRERLAVIENFITDISVCSPDEHQKYVSFEWTSASGRNNRYNICVDGDNKNTKDILKFAYAERDRLRSSLQSETKKLSERCNGNCNGNYSVYGRGGQK